MIKAVNLAESDREYGIPIFKIGSEVRHPSGDFFVSEEWAQNFVDTFHAFYEDRPYKAPILFGHKEDGLSAGIVLDIKIEDGYITADVEYAEGVKELRESGRARNWSPSFYTSFEDPHSGKKYKYLLRELSIVSIPHMKDLKPVDPHYSLLESTQHLIIVPAMEIHMSKKAQKEVIQLGEDEIKEIESQEEDPKENEESPSVEDRLAKLEEFVKQMMEPKEEDPEMEEEEEVENEEDPEEDPDHVDNSEIAALRLQVFTYELREVVGNVDESKVESLYKLREYDPSLYEITLASLKGSKGSGSTNKPVILNEEKGRTGLPQGKVSKERILSLAEEKGLTKEAKLDFLESQGYFKS